MTEVILHHYPMSPYAEKVRKALGIKRLAWRSVTIPVIMPKPDLMPLTGGYRKTPVMQIGADIYCDTQMHPARAGAALSRAELLSRHAMGHRERAVLLSRSHVVLAGRRAWRSA